MKKNNLQDNFEVLRKIQKKLNTIQRELALKLGFIMGKLNYYLKVLRDKGLIEIENFKKNLSKVNYFYSLTIVDITEKIKLTLNFIRKKMKEYDELKKEFLFQHI